MCVCDVCVCVRVQMLSWAYAVLNAHAERKSMLEVCVGIDVGVSHHDQNYIIISATM